MRGLGPPSDGAMGKGAGGVVKAIRPRKRQREGGKQGRPFDEEKRRLLGCVWTQAKVLLKSGSSFYVGKKKLRTVKEVFEYLTKCSGNVGRTNREDKPGGAVQPTQKKGPKPVLLEERFADFYEWVVEKIENAKKGSFVTLDSLKRDLDIENGIPVSKRLLRRTLRRLGFKYVTRVGKWFSRRNEERIQRRLADFLEFAVQNSSFREEIKKGKTVKVYYWNVPVAFEDESFVHEKGFRKASICAPVEPGSKTVDRTMGRQAPVFG